jgi:hypothetical protein
VCCCLVLPVLQPLLHGLLGDLSWDWHATQRPGLCDFRLIFDCLTVPTSAVQQQHQSCHSWASMYGLCGLPSTQESP